MADPSARVATVPSMLSLISTIRDGDEAVGLLFVFVVLGCLVAAGVAAFRGFWIACLCLLAVAIVAAAVAF